MTSRFAPPPGEENKLKLLAGEEAAGYVKDGMVVGLGTGSTVYYTIRSLGNRIKNDNLDILAIPTSLDTRNLARELDIPLTNLNEDHVVNVTIDGADEVDPELNLVKGLGGALLMEKIVASASKKEIIIVDPGKIVDRLGRGKLPVEVVKFGVQSTLEKLRKAGMNPTLRTSETGVPFITDNNNYIVDCLPGKLENSRETERKLNAIPGVVENGLFIDLTELLIIGKKSGIELRTEDIGNVI